LLHFISLPFSLVSSLFGRGHSLLVYAWKWTVAIEMKLNPGCGKDTKREYVNLDLKHMKGVDVMSDLNRFPYPCRGSVFDERYCNNILEHLEDVVGVMEGLHGICRPQAKIVIKVPHFTCQYAFGDPTHKNYFTYESFDYFTLRDEMDDERPDWYSDVNFRIRGIKLIFSKGLLLPWNYIFEWVFNKIPKYYEGTILRIFPAGQMVIIMEVVKD